MGSPRLEESCISLVYKEENYMTRRTGSWTRPQRSSSSSTASTLTTTESWMLKTAATAAPSAAIRPTRACRCLKAGWLLLTKSAERQDVEEEMNAHNHGPNPKPKPKAKPKPRSKPKPARAVVERVMAALKRWRVLVTQYHLSNRNRAKKIIFVVACLTNYQLANDCSSARALFDC